MDRVDTMKSLSRAGRRHQRHPLPRPRGPRRAAAAVDPLRQLEQHRHRPRTAPRNWARTGAPQIQRYVHAYRAATGVDLTVGAGRARRPATCSPGGCRRGPGEPEPAMPDFTSALFLDRRHDSAGLGGWPALTSGRPAAAEESPAAAALGRRVARAAWCRRRRSSTARHCTRSSTSCRLLARPGTVVLLDRAAYPLARTAALAVGGTVPVGTFSHHDGPGLVAAADRSRRRPVVVTDGWCSGCSRPAPLPGLERVARDRGGVLVVDDTQAVGVLGGRAARHPPFGRGGGGTFRWLGAAPGGAVQVAVPGQGVRGAAGGHHRPRSGGRPACGVRHAVERQPAERRGPRRGGAGHGRRGGQRPPAGRGRRPGAGGCGVGCAASGWRWPGGRSRSSPCSSAGSTQRRHCTGGWSGGRRARAAAAGDLPAPAARSRFAVTARHVEADIDEALAVLDAARRRAGGGPVSRPVVIDAHCHAGTGDGLSGPWDTAAPLRGVPAAGRARPASPTRCCSRRSRRTTRGRTGRSPGSSGRRRAGSSGSRSSTRSADRGRVAAMVGTAVDAVGLPRDQGALARRPDHPGDRRGRPAPAGLPVLYDPRGDTATVETVARAYPGRGLDHPAPVVLRRRLAAQVRVRRPARPAAERLHRHVRRALLRPARRRGPPGRPAQGALRQRRPVPAPGCRAGQGARAAAATRPAAGWSSAATCAASSGGSAAAPHPDRGGRRNERRQPGPGADPAEPQQLPEVQRPGLRGDQAAQRGQHQEGPEAAQQPAGRDAPPRRAGPTWSPTTTSCRPPRPGR